MPPAPAVSGGRRRVFTGTTSSTRPVDGTVGAGQARRAVVRPRVWVTDDNRFPEDGYSSPGVTN